MTPTASTSDVLPSARTDSNHSMQISTTTTSPSSSFYEILIHGSCRKCKHYHTALPFTVTKDPTKHVRFRCEKCEHNMFGFGLNSTQTTLLSEESHDFNPRNSRGSLAPVNSIIPCTNNVRPSWAQRSQIEISTEAAQPVEPLTPISEDSTALRRDATNPRSRPQEVSIVPGTARVHVLPATEKPLGSAQGNWTESGNPWAQKPSKFRQMLDRLGLSSLPDQRSQKHVAKRNWHSIFRWKAKDRSGASQIKRGPESRGTLAKVPTVEETSSHHPSFVNMGQADERVPEATSQAEQHSNILSGDQATKTERILRVRREKTRKRVAEQASRCRCDSGCYCMSRNVGSNIADIGQRSSSDIEIPSHHLGSIMQPRASSSEDSENASSRVQLGSLVFVGIGAQHADLHSGSVDPDTSSSTAVSGHSDSRTVSTTAVGSNGSSTTDSLNQTRPQLDRSASVPVPPRGAWSRPQSSLRRPRNRSNLQYSQDVDGLYAVPHTSEDPGAQEGSDASSDVHSTESLHSHHGVNGTLRDGLHNGAAAADRSLSPLLPALQASDDQNHTNASSEEQTPRPQSQVIETDPLTTPPPQDFGRVSYALQQVRDERSDP